MEKILERAASLKVTQQRMARELGFDGSREIFVKGEDSVVML